MPPSRYHRQMMRSIPALNIAYFLALVAALAAQAPAVDEAANITLKPDWNAAGVHVADDFLGLSFETKMLLPADTDGGRRFFRADNAPLVSMFHSLAVRSLRI